MTTIAQHTPAEQPERGGPEPAAEVVGGVDTHLDSHTAAVLDSAGRLLGTEQFAASPAGYRQLLGWLRGFGRLLAVGVEGTGSYGAGLARQLAAERVAMVEVDRPDRKTRRHRGKSDPVDAEAAARTALAGTRTGTPKAGDGQVEALRQLRVTRRSAVEQRADVQRQLKSLLVTAAEPLREQLRSLTDRALIDTCAGLRPDPARIGAPDQAAKYALRALARRHQALSAEIADLDALIEPLVRRINPRLLDAFGVGPETAGQLLITAGQNVDRLRTEGSFAMLCGAAPIPATSGKRQHRHRLNRGGDRQANAALYRLVLTRMAWHEPTKAYVRRRTTDGLTKKEIIRCLKRYVAREIYYLLRPGAPTTRPTPTAA